MTDISRALGGATAPVTPHVEGQIYPADYEAKAYARLNPGVALGPNERLMRFTRDDIELTVICTRKDAWRACAALFAAGYTGVVLQ